MHFRYFYNSRELLELGEKNPALILLVNSAHACISNDNSKNIHIWLVFCSCSCFSLIVLFLFLTTPTQASGWIKKKREKKSAKYRRESFIQERRQIL